MIKLKNITMLLLLSVATVSAASSIMSTLQSKNVATIYCLAFQGTPPTKLLIDSYVMPTNQQGYQITQYLVPLSTSIALNNLRWNVNNNPVTMGVFVSMQNFSLSMKPLLDYLSPCMEYSYTVNDIFGKQLVAVTKNKNILKNGFSSTNSAFSDPVGNLNNNVVRTTLDKGSTLLSTKNLSYYYKQSGTPFVTWGSEGIDTMDTSVWSQPYAFFIVQPIWQAYDVLPNATLPATTPLISNAGAIGSVGLPLIKTQMDQDIEILMVTNPIYSQSVGVQIPETYACVLSQSSSFLNNATDLAAGVYVYLSQPVNALASGDTYAIFDNNGNQLGTGNIEIIGSINSSVAGMVMTGSGFENGCFAMQAPTNGVWPSMFVLQYVASGGTVTLPVPSAAAPATGKHGKHAKHGKKRSLKKELHHEWKKYEKALNITSTGVLPADSVQVLKVKKAEKHVLKALKKASLSHKKFKKKLDNLWDNYTTAATSGNSASVAAVVSSIKKEEKKMLDALAAASA